MARYLTDKQVFEVTNLLLGTCISDFHDEFLELEIDELKLTDEDWEIINAYVYPCDSCGWWYDTEELEEYDGELLCSNCLEEYEEEEEE